MRFPFVSDFDRLAAAFTLMTNDLVESGQKEKVSIVDSTPRYSTKLRGAVWNAFSAIRRQP
jgi:hypothetical protein